MCDATQLGFCTSNIASLLTPASTIECVFGVSADDCGCTPSLTPTPTELSGIVQIGNTAVSATVTPGVTLTAAPIVQLTFLDDNYTSGPPPTCANPVGVQCWYNVNLTNPTTQFDIRISSTPALNTYYKIAWTLIRP